MEEPVDVTPYLDQLDESLRDKVLQLQKGRWVQTLLPALVPGTSCYLDGVQVVGVEGQLKLHEKCLWLMLGSLAGNRGTPTLWILKVRATEDWSGVDWGLSWTSLGLCPQNGAC